MAEAVTYVEEKNVILARNNFDQPLKLLEQGFENMQDFEGSKIYRKAVN